MKKILITGIGSYAAQYTINTLHKEGYEVHGADINRAEVLYESTLVDHFYQVPYACEEERFIQRILSICEEHQIKYILPLTDPGVDVFSKFSKSIEDEGLCLCISSSPTIELCREKFSFFKFFKDDEAVNVIPTVPFNERGILEYPLILKKKRGRSSQGLIKAYSANDLNINNPNFEEYIIQPLLEGTIITVDFIRESSTNISYTVAREELIRTPHGAGTSVKIIEDSTLTFLCQHLGESLKIKGCVCMEFILCEGVYYLMDLNPRFSAGISFSEVGGYNMVSNHLKCFQNTPLERRNKYIKDRYVVKKFTDVII